MKKSNVSTTTEQVNPHAIEQIVRMLHQHRGELEAIYAGLPSSDSRAKDIDGLLWHLAIDTKDNRDEEIHTRVAGFLRNGGTIDVMQQSIDHAKRTLPPPSANVKQKSDNSKHKLRDIKHDVLPTATNSRQTLQNQNATSEIEELQLVEQHLTELMGAGQQTLRQRFHHLAEDKQGLQRDTVSEQLAELSLIRDEILSDDGSHGEFQQHINAIRENCLPPNQLARQASPIEAALATAIATLERALIYVHAPTTHWRSKNRALHILHALTDSYKAEQQTFVRLASNPNTHEQYQQAVVAYADLVNVAILGGNRYLLPAPIARKLLCINQYGELEKSNETGQHAVCSAKGIHYKPQQRESTPDDPDISPGKEYAIGSLLQLIAGEQLVAAPTMLLDIQKVPIESKQGAFVPRFLQAGLTIDGILLRDYLFLQDGLNIWGKQIGSQPLANIVDDAHQGFKDSIKSVQEAFPDLLGAYQAFCQHQQGKQALSAHENASQYRIKKLNLVRELYSAFQEIVKASNVPNILDDGDDLHQLKQVEVSLSTIDDQCDKTRGVLRNKFDEWIELYFNKKDTNFPNDTINTFMVLLYIMHANPQLCGKSIKELLPDSVTRIDGALTCWRKIAGDGNILSDFAHDAEHGFPETTRVIQSDFPTLYHAFQNFKRHRNNPANTASFQQHQQSLIQELYNTFVTIYEAHQLFDDAQQHKRLLELKDLQQGNLPEVILVEWVNDYFMEEDIAGANDINSFMVLLLVLKDNPILMENRSISQLLPGKATRLETATERWQQFGVDSKTIDHVEVEKYINEHYPQLIQAYQTFQQWVNYPTSAQYNTTKQHLVDVLLKGLYQTDKALAKNDKHSVKEIEETNSQLYQQTLNCYGIVKDWVESYLENHEKKVHEKSGDNANPFLNLLGILKQHPTLISLGHPVSLLVDHIKTFHYVHNLFPSLPSFKGLSPTERAIQESRLLLTKKYLDQAALSALWLGQLLCLPTDAKSDNFMLTLTYHTPTQIKIGSNRGKHQPSHTATKQSSTSNLYRCRLVSIDNDLGLTMPFEKRGENFILRHIKNILLSIPELRECVLSARVRENFLAMPAKQQWLTWLSIVARRDIHFTHWMSQSAVSMSLNKQQTSIDFPVSLDQHVIDFILDRWQTLQKHIENTPKTTLLGLTNYLYPAVSFLYEARLKKITCDEIHQGRPLVAEDEQARNRQGDLLFQRRITPNSSSYYVKSAQAHSQQGQKRILAQHFLYDDILLDLQWHTMTSSERWVYLSSLALLPQLIKSSWIKQTQTSKDTDAITLALQHGLKHAIQTARPLIVYQLLKLGAQLDQLPSAILKLAGDDSYCQQVDNYLDLFCTSVAQGDYYTSYEQVNLMTAVLFSQGKQLINEYNSQGYTPLQQCVNQAIDLSVMSAQKRQMMLTLLDKFITHGAHLEAKDSYKHETILDKVCKLSAYPLKIDWFIALIERGAGIHANPDKIMAFINKWPRQTVQRHVALLGLLSERNLGLQWKLSQRIWQQSTARSNKKAIPVNGIATKETVLFKAAQIQLAKEIKKPSATHTSAENDTSAYGRRVVKRIKTNIDKATSKSNSALIPCAVDWYFKLYPEMPGVEMAVTTFSDMLFGYHTAPHELLALDTHKAPYPALTSQTVLGENLQTVLNTLTQNASAPALGKHQADVVKASKMLHSLHPRYLSEQIILAMLLNPEDGKPDNFQLIKILDGSENITGDPCYRLVGIDNDHAFIQTATLSTDKATVGEVELQMKSVLFCFDQMRQPIDSAVRARILSIKLEDNQQRHEQSFLQQWLESSILKQYEVAILTLFNEVTRKQLFERGVERWSEVWRFGKLKRLKKDCPVVLQIPFHQEMISGLYRRFAKLKALLTTCPTITHLKLLEELDPVAGVFYRGAFQHYPQPLKIFERFHTVAAQSYEQLAHNQLSTVTTSKVALEESGLSDEKVKAIYKDSTVNEMSLQQAIETLRETVASCQYEALLSEKLAVGNEEELETFLNQHQLDKLQSWFMQLTALKIKLNPSNTADKSRQERIIDIILNVNTNNHIQKLHLENCMTLTDKQLEKFLKNSPMLTKLTVINCSELTSAIFNSMSEHLNVLESLRIRQLLVEEMDVSSEFVQLERCDISHNPALNRIDVIAPMLRKARIHENRALTQVELTSERLSLLNLSLNPAMTDQAMIDAVKPHPLMSLNLYGSQHANSILPTVLFQENSLLAVSGILTGAEKWLAQFEQSLDDEIVTLVAVPDTFTGAEKWSTPFRQCLNAEMVTLDIDTLQTNLVLQEAVKIVLGKNSKITTLNINVIELTAELLDLLIEESKKHKSVCNMQLSYQMTHIDDLANKLKVLFTENPGLVINGHTAQSMQDFEKSYMENDQHNSTITFKKDTLTSIDLTLLLQHICNKSLETITIQYQQLSDSHNLAAGLHAITQTQPNLRSLMVNGVEYIELITAVAQQSCDLWEMTLQPFEQELVINSLKANHHITQLNLSVTGFDDKRALLLASSLNASNGLRNSLVKLNVSSNKVTNDGAHYLMAGLQHNNTLTDLNLSYNQIDNFSRSTVINPVFKYNYTLLSVNLESNPIRQQAQLDELSKKLKRNQQLVQSTSKSLQVGEITTVIKQCKQGVSPYTEFPPQSQHSLLHVVAQLGQLDVMQYLLLSYTLCLDLKNEVGCTPLDEAVNAGQFVMAKLLQHPQKSSYLAQTHTTAISKINVFQGSHQVREKNQRSYDKQLDPQRIHFSFTEQFGELNSDRLHTLSDPWQTTLQNIHGELTISDFNDVPIATSWMNDAQIKRLLFDCFSLSDGPDKTGGIYYIPHMNKSPCDSDIAIAREVAFEVAKQICGYYSNQGEQEELYPGLVSSGNELDKPVVMIWNTETVLAEQSSQIDKSGGRHWQTCVILPKNYCPYYGGPLENDTELVYFVDSKYPERTMPNSLKQMLTTDNPYGEEYTFECEGYIYEFSVGEQKYSHRIANPFSIQEKQFITCQAHQQRDDNDCGYWAVYNAIMLVCTGRDEYLKQFSERRYANPLRHYFDRIISNYKLSEEYQVQGMGSTLSNSISSFFTTSRIKPTLVSTKTSVLKSAQGLSPRQLRRQNELTKACAEANLERVKQLVAQGANLVMPDETGQQPLAATLWEFSFNVLQYLEEQIPYTNGDWQMVAEWLQRRNTRVLPLIDWQFLAQHISSTNTGHIFEWLQDKRNAERVTKAAMTYGVKQEVRTNLKRYLKGSLGKRWLKDEWRYINEIFMEPIGCWSEACGGMQTKQEIEDHWERYKEEGGYNGQTNVVGRVIIRTFGEESDVEDLDWELECARDTYTDLRRAKPEHNPYYEVKQLSNEFLITMTKVCRERGVRITSTGELEAEHPDVPQPS